MAVHYIGNRVPFQTHLIVKLSIFTTVSALSRLPRWWAIRRAWM